MGILAKIRRHAAVAGADFTSMFKQVEVPPLPAAATRLIAEINQPEPDIGQLVKLISSTAGIAAKVIKTVNSSLFALRKPVTNVKQAVTLLGVRHIRSIALAYATMEALPAPKGDLFDHEAFWTDSLLRAMLARSFSKERFTEQLEDAFTASLLADVALPVLLRAWQEYYEPVIQEWMQSPRRLSEIEREHFGWDHAQAGAWIVQSWEFPEETVCYIGAHNLSWEKIREHELEDTIVVPMAVATISSSVLKPDLESSRHVFSTAVEWLSITSSEFVDCIAEVKQSLGEILELFGLPDRNAGRILSDLETAATSENEREET
jgi:HD-like signal output (HDOD) protein